MTLLVASTCDRITWTRDSPETARYLHPARAADLHRKLYSDAHPSHDDKTSPVVERMTGGMRAVNVTLWRPPWGELSLQVCKGEEKSRSVEDATVVMQSTGRAAARAFVYHAVARPATIAEERRGRASRYINTHIPSPSLPPPSPVSSIFMPSELGCAVRRHRSTVAHPRASAPSRLTRRDEHWRQLLPGKRSATNKILMQLDS